MKKKGQNVQISFSETEKNKGKTNLKLYQILFDVLRIWKKTKLCFLVFKMCCIKKNKKIKIHVLELFITKNHFKISLGFFPT